MALDRTRTLRGALAGAAAAGRVGGAAAARQARLRRRLRRRRAARRASSPRAAPATRSGSRCTSLNGARVRRRLRQRRRRALPGPAVRCAGRSPGWPSTSRPGRWRRCVDRVHPARDELPELWGNRARVRAGDLAPPAVRRRARRARAAAEPARAEAAPPIDDAAVASNGHGSARARCVAAEPRPLSARPHHRRSGFAGRPPRRRLRGRGRRGRRRSRARRRRRPARRRRGPRAASPRRAAGRRLPPRRARPRRARRGRTRPATLARQRRDDAQRARGRARRGARGASVVAVGSGEVYGPPATLPVDEDAPLRPQNPYAVSKASRRPARRLLRRRARAARDPRARVQPRRARARSRSTRSPRSPPGRRGAGRGRRPGRASSPATRTRAATSPTCATSSAPTGCSPSAASRASTTSAPGGRRRRASCSRRSAAVAGVGVDHEVDPKLVRAHEVMEVRGVARAAARGDRLGAGDPARADARRHRRVVARGDPRGPRGHARARVSGAEAAALPTLVQARVSPTVQRAPTVSSRMLELLRERPNWLGALSVALTRPPGMPERRTGEDPWATTPDKTRPRRITDDLAWLRQAFEDPAVARPAADPARARSSPPGRPRTPPSSASPACASATCSRPPASASPTRPAPPRVGPPRFERQPAETPAEPTTLR